LSIDPLLEEFLADLRTRLTRLEEKLKPEPLCLPYPAAAARLGVGLTKLKRMVKAGVIRKSLVGEVPMISLSELQRVATPPAERPKIEAAQRKAAWVPVKRKRG
jgi:hypothetical protein